MNRDVRAGCRWAGFICAYLFANFLCSVLPTRLFWYLPLEHRFSFEVRPVTLAIDFYGRVLWSLLAGALGLVAAHFAARSAVALRYLTVWAVSLLILTSGLYAWVLLRRVPAQLSESRDVAP